MRSSGNLGRGGGPAGPVARPARVVAAVRAVLRPRVGALSWAGSRLLAGSILVAGLIAQVLFGWRWWLVVIVLTVAGEAILVCSTLARSAQREELVDELLAALAPGRRERRLARLDADRFRAAPFALYGLPPDWTGPRFLGRWSSTRPRRAPELITSLELGHGDPDAGGAILLVEVAPWTTGPRSPAAPGVAVAEPAAPGVAVAEPAAPGVAVAEPASLGAEPAAVGVGVAEPAARRVEIPVDGVPVGFELAGDARRWVARGEHGALVLRLEARDLDPSQVILVRIVDLAPYLTDTGARQLAPGA